MDIFGIEPTMPDSGKLSRGDLHAISTISCGNIDKLNKPYRLSILLPLICTLVLLSCVLLTGCGKQQPEMQSTDILNKEDNTTMNYDDEFQNAYKNDFLGKHDKTIGQRFSGLGFSFPTFLEFPGAQAATVRHDNFSKAVPNDYTDINVTVPHMSYHFTKSAIVDANFGIQKPEILVNNNKLNESFHLVTVAYAVSMSVSHHKEPQELTVPAEVWQCNAVFGLWVQHACIWRFNDGGVFNGTNPSVPVR